MVARRWSAIQTGAGVAALLLASSCTPHAQGGTGGQTPAEGTPEPAVQSFDLSDMAPERILSLPDASINDIPIHVWVKRGAGKAITKIRVTGHANSEVCSKASLDLSEMLTDHSSVAGFLGFGVAELRPAAGATAYADKASALIEEISALQQTYPKFVQLHEVTQDRPDLDGAPPDDVSDRTGVLRFRNPAAGPAFVPVRSWSAGEAPAAVTFEVKASELGVSEPLMQRLAPNIASAPIVEHIVMLRDSVQRIDRLEQFLAAGGQLADHTKGYEVSGGSGLVTEDQIKTYNELLTRFERFLDASKFLYKLSRADEIQHESDARDVAAKRQVNDFCLARLRHATGCLVHYAVEPVYPKSDAERAEIAKMDETLAAFSTTPASVFESAKEDILRSLNEEKRVLDMARNEPQAQAKAAARETAIDGLLRGWPLPIPDDPALEREVIAVQEDKAPDAWPRILARLGARGIDLTDSVGAAGVLTRGNVFFSVRYLGGDRYRGRRPESC